MTAAPWALVLGASSGIGAACARHFARAGYHVAGVHLDRRAALAGVEDLLQEIASTGQDARFFNTNAARDESRAEVVTELRSLLDARGERLGVVVHALAFGSLLPLVDPAGGSQADRRQVDMTLDVMATTLLWWTQDLIAARLLGDGGRVFALTSAGSHRALPSYGPVALAKAALEALVRQLALELAPLGVTVNAIQAGVTRTPALLRIPGHEALLEDVRRRSPHGRNATPDDVAACLVELARPGTRWLTGNTLRVDGGEDLWS